MAWRSGLDDTETVFAVGDRRLRAVAPTNHRDFDHTITEIDIIYPDQLPEPDGRPDRQPTEADESCENRQRRG